MRTNLSIFLFFAISGIVISQTPELVVDFNAGDVSSFSNWNYSGGEIGDHIVVPLISENNGEELGVISNGELQILKDIFVGAESSEPQEFTLYNDLLYFSAKNAENDFAIWKTDGTPEGTVLDYDPGTNGNTRPRAFTVAANGWMYYNYDGKIFRTNGSTHEELYNGAYLNYDFGNGSYNYCTYKNGIAWVGKNGDDTFTIKHLDDDQVVELATTVETDFFADGFGIAPVSTGLMFSIYDSDVDGIYLYKESDQSLSPLLVDGELIPSRRIINFSEEKNISWLGGKGYYIINGVEGEEELIFESDNSSATQGENLLFGKFQNKAVFVASEGFWGDEFILHTDGTGAGTTNLVELQPYTSDILTYKNFGFIADGTSNGFDPIIYQVDIETGDLTTVYSYNLSSNNTNSIRPIGVQGSYFYYISNLDPTVGSELYRILVEVGVSPNIEIANPNLDFSVAQRDNKLEIKMAESKAIDVSISNAAGQTVFNSKLNSNQSFEVNLINGLYFLTVATDDKLQSKTIKIIN